VTGNDLRLAWCRKKNRTADIPQIDGHLAFGGPASRFTCIRLKTKPDPDALYQWGRVSPLPAPPS
jgi:hypothetical protein